MLLGVQPTDETHKQTPHTVWKMNDSKYFANSVTRYFLRDTSTQNRSYQKIVKYEIKSNPNKQTDPSNGSLIFGAVATCRANLLACLLRFHERSIRGATVFSFSIGVECVTIQIKDFFRFVLFIQNIKQAYMVNKDNNDNKDNLSGTEGSRPHE